MRELGRMADYEPGRYVFEGKLDDGTTLLRWQGTVEGHDIESLELLTDDADGLLLERTVAYRPFPAQRPAHPPERGSSPLRHVGQPEVLVISLGASAIGGTPDITGLDLDLVSYAAARGNRRPPSSRNRPPTVAGLSSPALPSAHQHHNA